MVAQGLEVDHLQPVPLHVGERAPHMVELAAGKNVAVDEALIDRPLAELAQVLRRGAGDRLVQVEPLRAQQSVDAGEERVVIVHAYMLEHAELAHPVILLGGLDVAIVAQLQRDEIGQPLALHLRAREGELLLRQRHAVDVRAVVPGGVAREAAPAAADVQHPVSRREAQLAAALVQLRHRRLGERRAGIREIAVRVDHLGVEKESVEGVRHVVMVRDQLLVAPPALDA